MADETNDQTDGDVLDGDRGIPSVSSEGGGAGFGLAMAVFAIIGVFVIWMFWPESDATPDEALPAQVDEDFNRQRVAEVVIPDLPPDPLPLPEPARTVAIGGAPAPALVQAQLSPEELRALQEAADLRERRRRSPLVIFDATSDNLSAAVQPVIAQEFGGGALNGAASRQQALLEAIRNVNVPGGAGGLESLGGAGGLGGLGGAGARNSDRLDGRLEESPAMRVTASYLRDREYTIAQGKMIGGVIESAISSDLPGMVRALVSEMVYSEDGRNVLIEKGSRIVGEYRAGLVRGRARIFVIWNRVITPNGIDIQITSPGADSLGRSGLTGWIDSHFMERFGASVMLSIVGAAAAQQNDNQFNVELGQGFNESAEIALENSINIRPTLYKNQGDRIKIFVARDLNFKPVFGLRSQ